MRWLSSPDELAGALRAVAPDLSGFPVVVPPPVAKDDPLWWSSSAAVGERFVAKFAWSRPAALRVAHEIRILTALARDSGVPFLPEMVASSTDPVLFVTRLVPGATLFEVIGSIDRDRAGEQVARFLAALHGPATRRLVEAAVGELRPAHEGPQHPAPTAALRDRFVGLVGPARRRLVGRWCDWADATLATPGPSVVVHADLHGDNQVWDGDELRLVVDYETVAAGEPEYDVRTLPGTGPGIELLTATMRHYRRLTDHRLALDRVMAWHLRTALGDVLWRGEAGIPLADGRTPSEWVDDLSARFGEAGLAHAS
jgi:aminoglycoside phosphotransferase (APT) family kinase protein